MVRTDPGAPSETTVARIDRRGNPLSFYQAVARHHAFVITDPPEGLVFRSYGF